MESKITIETRRQQRRRNRDAVRSHSNDGSKSPPVHSRVVILAKNPQKPTSPTVSQHMNSSQQNQSQTIQIISSAHSSQTSTPINSSAITSNSSNSLVLTDDFINDLVSNTPKIMKMIDNETLVFMESPASDYLFNDNISPNGFSVITAVGLDGVGKSSILNKIAGKDIFKTHTNENHSQYEPLRHLTRGIDLHVTKERLLLLDSQPFLSASVLDEYLKSSPLSSSSTGVDIAEPENYSFMISLQLLSFLLASCDYIIIVCEWMLDIHLMKLIATSVMMVGDSAPKADIIFYFPRNKSKINRNTIDSLLGRGLYVTVICGDEKQLLNSVMKAPSKRISGENGRTSHTSEKSWLSSSSRLWETSIRKSTLYNEYSRILP